MEPESMEHPFNRWSPQTSGWLFFGALLLTSSFSVSLSVLGQPLINQDVAPGGMISFELAGTSEKSQEIVESWSADARVSAFWSLVVDFGFIVAYASTLSFACLLASKSFAGRDWSSLSYLARCLAGGQVFAGLLDVVENSSLLYILHLVPAEQTIPWPFPALAALCAGLKFALIGVGMCCVIAAITFSCTTERASR
jgi:hypothetical protein